MIKLSDYIFKFLADNGADHVFMLSGGGCMHLCDSLGRSKLGFTCCLNEQAVTIASLGYAQYKNDLGVALVTSGPGGTNAVTGVLGAWTESVPMFVLSGQVKRDDLAGDSGIRSRGVQEAPIIDIIKPVTKYAVMVTEPAEIRYHMEKALHLARSGRPGPVWLDIPLDVQSAMVDENAMRGFETQEVQTDLTRHVDKIIGMIREAKRPVILAGYGVRLSKKTDEFMLLVNELQIPVLTTWKAIDIMPQEHPLFMGRPGIAGQRAANLIQQNADLIIVMGARLDFPQTGFNRAGFAREAKKIIIDIDKAELEKFEFSTDLAVCANVGDVIDTLRAKSPNSASVTEWLKYCESLKNSYGCVPPEDYGKTGYASLYCLVETISDIAGTEDLIVPGSSGMGSDVSYQVTKIKEGQRMLNSPGIGSMGFGIPSSLGACIASGGRRTICVNGDGGFQMNIQELETVASLNLPIKFFVINNSGYASIRNTQRNYFNGFYVGSSPESGVSLPDVKKLGAAYGYSVFQIAKNDEIKDIVEKAVNTEGPVICEVMIDPKDMLSFKASSRLMPDGTAISAPFEDLFPFLPRKEFYSRMIVKPMNKTGINICSVLFDLDGTLIDSREGIVNAAMYAAGKSGMSHITKADIEKCIGLPLMSMVYKLFPEAGEEQARQLATYYREHYTETGIYECELYDGVRELLEYLRKDFNLYIVTSKALPLAQKAVKKLNIDSYFDDIFGVGLDFTVKKKSDLIKELLEKHGLSPEKCVMVGDRAEDVTAAAGNNIKTIAVSYGYGEVSELKDAIMIANSTAELRQMIY